MSVIYRDTDFEPSRSAQHYRPPHQLTRIERVVRAVSCLALFAALGVCFAVGLSGCGGGEPEADRSTAPRVNCSATPEKCT